MYFTITTITTVGFGDISPETPYEKLYACVIMIIGVIGFSLATGTLTSMLSTLDSAKARLKEKLDTLEDI